MNSSEKALKDNRQKEVLFINDIGNKNSLRKSDRDVEFLENVGISIIKPHQEYSMKRPIEEQSDKNDKYIETNKPRWISSLSENSFDLFPEFWYIENFKVRNIWDYSPMKKVTIAVIDSGINTAHPQFNGKVKQGFNFITDSTDTSDENGHGTAVSGVISSLIGSMPIEILPLKAIFPNGEAYVSDIVRAINYAIEQNVDVINLSLGADVPSIAEKQAITAALEKGITIVASAGNDGVERYSYPASYDGVLSVGSINEQHEVSIFSNYNDKIFLTAPGENILTASNLGVGGYKIVNGTSFSAAYISGIMAMLKSLEPTLSLKEQKLKLMSTAEDKGEVGWDVHYGNGIVMPYLASQQIRGKEWDSHTTSLAQKEWDIQFNLAINESSIINNGIEIISSTGEIVETQYSISTNKRTVKILPKEPLKGCEDYWLKIKGGVKSLSGQELSDPVTMKFHVEMK
ncbi:S8 family serine peptidase [Bacillus salipaludis]|uniref:S8 family serine peptidase n=1 Tax=Bacillus salipaludis TaxID=2547811 RepID=UPI003D194B3D